MIALIMFIAPVPMKNTWRTHISTSNIVVMIKSGPIYAAAVPSVGEVVFEMTQISTACNSTPSYSLSQNNDLI